MTLLDDRRAESKRRLTELHENLQGAEKLIGQNGCVYVTGSFARGDASTRSDLDLFVVGDTDEDGTRRLSRLDEICIMAQLIEATRTARFPDFSGDGEYLRHYTVEDLVELLGTERDDAENTLTARLLLLLESQPLIGRSVYQTTIDRVLTRYWRDFESNADRFSPAFLANDILRLWRTFCVNYEARTSVDSPERTAKRRLKNHKLKHSRLLTCYSALAFLSAKFRLEGTVNLEAAKQMVALTPTERLDWLAAQPELAATERVREILDRYEAFLDETNRDEDELLELFKRPDWREHFRQPWEMGGSVASLLEELGHGGNRFHRVLLV